MLLIFKDIQRNPGCQRRWSLLPAMIVAILFTWLATSGTLAAPLPQWHASRLIGPKAHYLALGDSLAFGYQPNQDYTHGYVTDYFQLLAKHGTRDVTNYGCPFETSITMIHGGCLAAPQGTPAQLVTALAFLKTHAGNVSPVTLDIGANDMLPDSNFVTCTLNKSHFEADLAKLDVNLKSILLPQLHKALIVHGHLTGDLVVMNYYDPSQNLCPRLLPYTEILNQHIAKDVSGLGTLVDVFHAFGGAQIPNPNLSTDTWFSTPYHDVHPTTKGYRAIANAFAAATH